MKPSALHAFLMDDAEAIDIGASHRRLERDEAGRARQTPTCELMVTQ